MRPARIANASRHGSGSLGVVAIRFPRHGKWTSRQRHGPPQHAPAAFYSPQQLLLTLTIVKVATPLEFVGVRYLLTHREYHSRRVDQYSAKVAWIRYLDHRWSCTHLMIGGSQERRCPDQGLANRDDRSASPSGTNTTFKSLKQINAGLLNVGYAEDGPADGPPVLLLHGWPYDIHSFVDVAPRHV
jgi:hypothetical protein